MLQSRSTDDRRLVALVFCGRGNIASMWKE